MCILRKGLPSIICISPNNVADSLLDHVKLHCIPAVLRARKEEDLPAETCSGVSPGLHKPKSRSTHRIAGQDRALRLFSTIQDQQSRELSQRHTARRAKRLKVSEEELKLPRVIALNTCQVSFPLANFTVLRAYILRLLAKPTLFRAEFLADVLL